MTLPTPRNAPPKMNKEGPDLYIAGGFLWFRPPFYPSHEVKEWGGRWDGKQGAWRLPRLYHCVRDALAFAGRPLTTDDAVKELLEIGRSQRGYVLPRIQHAAVFDR